MRIVGLQSARLFEELLENAGFEVVGLVPIQRRDGKVDYTIIARDGEYCRTISNSEDVKALVGVNRG